MADTKKYLDFAGLSHYDEKIKAYIKTNGSDVTDKLVALIGAAEKGADEATILARIADLESAVGDVSELGDEVANLVKAILGEKARAEGAESDLQDAIDALDEKLYGSDSESEGESVHTKGDIDKIQDRLTAIEEDTTDADAVTTLEEKLYGKGEGEEHVDGDLDTINAAIAAEAKRAEDAEGDIMDFIGSIPEDAEAETVIGYVDEAVAAEEAARKAHIGELGKVSEEEGAADHTVKSYVDAAVAAASSDASDDLDALNKKLYGAEATDDAEAVVGDIPALQGRATTLETKVTALEATHATKTDGEGEEAVTSFKTVAEEAAEEVAKVVAQAPEAFDTLKEIAEWISASADNADGFDAANRIVTAESDIDSLESIVGHAATAGIGTEGDEGYVAPQDATGLVAKVAALEGLTGTESVADQIKAVTGTPDEEKTLQDEIDAIEESIADMNDAEVEGSLAARVKAIEDDLNDTDIFEAITDDEIDSLFDFDIENAETQSF